MLYKTFYESPLGTILLVADDNNLFGLWFLNQKHYMKNINERLVKNDELEIFKKVKRYLDNYFKGKNKSVIDVNLKPIGTHFQKIVWKELIKIPYGKTWTYTDVLNNVNKKMRRKTSVRVVASAISRNPISILIPCHRVIGKDGDLKGYAGGIERKASLIKLEHTSNI